MPTATGSDDVDVRNVDMCVGKVVVLAAAGERCHTR